MSAERYWEGRWRDERAENDRLLAALKELDTLFEFGAGTFSCACFPMGKQEHLQAAFKQAHAAIEASDEQPVQLDPEPLTDERLTEIAAKLRPGTKSE